AFEHAYSSIAPVRLIYPSIGEGLPRNDFQIPNEATMEPIVHIDCEPYHVGDGLTAISTILLAQFIKYIHRVEWALERVSSLVRTWDTDGSRYFKSLCLPDRDSSKTPA